MKLSEEAKKYKTAADFIIAELPEGIVGNMNYSLNDVKEFMKNVKIERISGSKTGNIIYKGHNLGRVITRYSKKERISKKRRLVHKGNYLGEISIGYALKDIRPDYVIAGDLKGKLIDVWYEASGKNEKAKTILEVNDDLRSRLEVGVKRGM